MFPRRIQADQPLIGFRTWVFRNGQIHSPMQPYVWHPGNNTAMCILRPAVEKPPLINWERWVRGKLPGIMPPKTAQVPGPNCQCGFYAWNHMQSAKDILGYGLIQAWGICIAHGAQGFRAQFGRILALSDGGRWSVFGPHYVAWHEMVAAAQQYGVPIIPYHRLELYGAEHGIVIGGSEWQKMMNERT